MTSMNHLLWLNVSIARTILVVFALVSMTGCASVGSTKEKVTLKDGKTYEVETVRGLPVPFANDQIKVRDLGMEALFKLDEADAPPYVWVLIADLIEKGRFAVTVTTPLDRSASRTFEAEGPGRIRQRFFPQADYPLIWEGINEPGVHWFPFHFVFEQRESKKRFEFTTWAKFDDRAMAESRALIEKVKQEMLKKR